MKNAFFDAIENVKEMFQRKGGVFTPRYVIHGVK